MRDHADLRMMHIQPARDLPVGHNVDVSDPRCESLDRAQ